MFIPVHHSLDQGACTKNYAFKDIVCVMVMGLGPAVGIAAAIPAWANPVNRVVMNIAAAARAICFFMVSSLVEVVLGPNEPV